MLYSVVRALRFSGANKNAHCFRSAVKAGLGDKLHAVKTGFLQHRQEIHSRYSAALSLKPVGKTVFERLQRIAFHHLVGEHQPSARFHHPQNFMQRRLLVRNQIDHAV